MKLLGIGGVAKAGKDSLFEVLGDVLGEHGVSSKRYAFADELKERANPFVKEQTGIDLFHCSDEEKEMVRPLMVSFGEVMRNLTQGRFWIDQINAKILEDQRDPILNNRPDVPIVTDVRFAEYEKDEAAWIHEQNGFLLHLTRYNKKGGKSIVIEPANPTEEANDPIVKEKSDIQLIWPSMEENNERVEFLKTWPGLDKLIKWIKN